MGTKAFIDINGLKLTSDERDVMVPAKYYDDVISWCNAVGIDLTVPGGNYSHQSAKKLFNVNLWRVKDEQQRMMFVLKWS